MINKSLQNKGFIVPVLIGVIAVLVIGGGVYLYKNKKVEAPIVVSSNLPEDAKKEVVKEGEDKKVETTTTSNVTVKQDASLKSFKLGTLEFSYPSILTLKKTGDIVSLGHSIAYKHQDSCDFVGDAPMLDRITDVGIGFEIIDKDVFNSIKLILSGDTAQALLKNNTITTDPGFIDKYKIGNLDGYKILQGIEACGGYKYYFPISISQTLVVSRNFYAQSLGQVWNPNLADKLKGLIPREKEEQIFKDILSSVKGLEQKETMSVKLYFPNDIKNPGSYDCSLVYPVTRTIPYTQSVANVTLAELIKGPTSEEKKLGFGNVLPIETKVNSIKIVDGVLSVDFNKYIEHGFTSCSGAARMSSIISTLKQFPTIKDIKFSVEGNSNRDEILQP